MRDDGPCAVIAGKLATAATRPEHNPTKRKNLIAILLPGTASTVT
jgi:hypothetical protein